jgi:hypothetical protein
MTGSPDTLPAPDLPPGPRAALVVATTRYADPALRQLRAPARDAADLAEMLADPEVGGFSVTPVIDRTAQDIRVAVGDFLTGRGVDGLLVVYLSCHGLVDGRGRLYFAATDTVKGKLAATALESTWLLEQMEDCRTRRQAVILDCCFSGAFAQGAKADTDLRLPDRFHGQGRGRVVLTASRSTEYSFEGEPVPGSAGAGSVFTTALVEGLRTGAADTDHDGYVSIDEAYAYAYDRIRAMGANQTPQRWLYGAEGSIVLARSRAGRAVVPAPLPEAVRVGLDSPHPPIRLGAVAVLGEWLTGADHGRALTARRTLQHVAGTDSPQVAAAARALLDADRSGQARATAPAPRPTPAPRPARVSPMPPAPAATMSASIPAPARPAPNASYPVPVAPGAGAVRYPSVEPAPLPQAASRGEPRRWPAYRILGVVALVCGLAEVAVVALGLAGAPSTGLLVPALVGRLATPAALTGLLLAASTGGRVGRWMLGTWLALWVVRLLVTVVVPALGSSVSPGVSIGLDSVTTIVGAVTAIGCVAGAWLPGWRRYPPLASALAGVTLRGLTDAPAALGYRSLGIAAALVLAIALVTLPGKPADRAGSAAR